MREPFAYESNVDLIRQALVPEPLSPAQWEAVLEGWRGRENTCTLLEWIVRQAYLGERQLLEALGAAFGVPVAHAQEILPGEDPSLEGQLLQAQGFAVLEEQGGYRRAAGGPVINPSLEDYLGKAHPEWQWVLVSPLREAVQARPCESWRPADRAGLGEWLEELLGSMVTRQVQDIHFERSGDALQVRFHEAGAMQLAGIWTGPKARAATRLLKTWAGLSTADTILPQDGRLQHSGKHGPLEFRVSHLPTLEGESLVLRVPGDEVHIRSLPDLGLPGELVSLMVDRALHDPGIILCTGSTGSGKTTTLYGLLRELSGHNLKILTIEDPVEYELPCAVQSGLDARNGWTFDAAVRAFLRQDPDLILLGEMRDAESAEAACRAALTGHCVLSTLHAGSVESALQRMAAWGIPHGTLAEAVRLVVHQKLAPAPGGMTASFAWLVPAPETILRILSGPLVPSAATSY